MRYGFVQEIVAPGAQKARGLVIARNIARQAPLAVRASLASSKRYVDRGPIGMAAEMDETQRVLSQSADAAEGVRSFVERRDANFEGR